MINLVIDIDFQKSGGLVPAVVQDEQTNEVLMLGYMNKQALEKTIETKYITFWSRSKNMLWLKGETSGNKLKVKNILIDCDGDTLLIKAELQGTNACHTGEYSCFYQKLL